AAGLVVAVAFAVLVVRFPAAISSFDHRAAHNEAQTPTDRRIAAADGLDISNDFVVQALRILPPRAPYAVLLAASAAAHRYGIVQTTLDALPGYVQFLLLPRRQVDASAAEWLLCYGCDLGSYRSRLAVSWQEDPG